MPHRRDKQFVWGANFVDELVLRDRDADASAGNGLEERLVATQDALYNVLSLVNTSGAVQERFSYAAYGVSTVLNANMSVKGAGTSYNWEHRFTGRRTDTTTGLQLNRNRFYHQSLGRWVTRDPIGYMGSEWNLYTIYFPMLLVDPSGLLCKEPEPEEEEPCGGLDPDTKKMYHLCMAICDWTPIKSPADICNYWKRFPFRAREICEMLCDIPGLPTDVGTKEWACIKLCCSGKLPKSMPDDACIVEYYKKVHGK